MGGDASDGVDADFDSDFEGTDAPFQMFTFRNLVNFFLGFGWGGISFYSSVESSTAIIAIAIVCGLIFVAVFFLVLKQIMKLAEDNSFKITDSINKTGEVYLTVPEKNTGSGKILVSVKGSMHELTAITSGDKLLKGTIVKVLKVEGDNMVSIQPIAN